MSTPSLLIAISEWGGKYIILFPETMSFWTSDPEAVSGLLSVKHPGNTSSKILSNYYCLNLFAFLASAAPATVFLCLCRCWLWKKKFSVGLVNVCCRVMIWGSSLFHCEKCWINLPSLFFPYSFNFYQPSLLSLEWLSKLKNPSSLRNFFHTETVPFFHTETSFSWAFFS